MDRASREFEYSLKDYVAALNLPAKEAQHAQQLIDQHDFSSARVHLIPSVPGIHKGTSHAQHCLITYRQSETHPRATETCGPRSHPWHVKLLRVAAMLWPAMSFSDCYVQAQCLRLP
jgi:hypothetical protein